MATKANDSAVDTSKTNGANDSDIMEELSSILVDDAEEAGDEEGKEELDEDSLEFHLVEIDATDKAKVLEEVGKTPFFQVKGIPVEIVKEKIVFHKAMYKLFVTELKTKCVVQYKTPWMKTAKEMIYFRIADVDERKRIVEALFSDYSWEYNSKKYTLSAFPVTMHKKTFISGTYKQANEEELQKLLDVLYPHRKEHYKDELQSKSNNARSDVLRVMNAVKKKKPGKAAAPGKAERKPEDIFVDKTVPLDTTDGYAYDVNLTIEEDPGTKKAMIGMKANSHVNHWSVDYLIPLKECIDVAAPLKVLGEEFIKFVNEDNSLRAYNRQTGEGNIVGLSFMMSQAGEILMMVILPKRDTSSVDMLFIPLLTDHFKANRGKAIEWRRKLAAEENAKAHDVVETTASDAKEAATGDVKAPESNGPKEGGISLNVTFKVEDHVNLPSPSERVELAGVLSRIKSDLLKFYESVAKNRGVVGLTAGWATISSFSLRGKWIIPCRFYSHLIGKTFIKDEVHAFNTFNYEMSFYKNNTHRTPAYIKVTDIVDRIAELNKTSQVIVASRHPYQFIYYAQKCKYVLMIHNWQLVSPSGQPISPKLKGDAKTKDAVPACLTGARLKGRLYDFIQNTPGHSHAALAALRRRSMAPKVALIWPQITITSAMLAELIKFCVKQVIIIMERTKFVDLKKTIQACSPILEVTRVHPVDCDPRGSRYYCVVVLEKPVEAPQHPSLFKDPRHSEGNKILPAMAVDNRKRPAPPGRIGMGPGGPPPKRPFQPSGPPFNGRMGGRMGGGFGGRGGPRPFGRRF